MTKAHRLYRQLYPILAALMWFFFRPKFRGRENVPDGACVVCSNHTSNLDCFFMILAMTRRSHVRILAKESLFRLPVVGPFLRAIGVIRVDRSINDMHPVRESLAHLKIGGKVGVFPMGRRVTAEESAEAKTGAVRIAEKTGAPVLPMYTPTRKRYFWRNTVVIGEPYYLNPERKKLAPEDFAKLSEELMARIEALAP
jgi:1-acyl-sn-glycerol-3-phosphate acyltransferase